MLTVLMTTDTIGGVWTYSLELAGAMADRGVKVALATMGRHLSPSQRREVEDLDLSVHESDFQLEWMQEPWQDVQLAGQWLLDLQRQTGADIIHLNGYAHAALPWSAPTVVAAHSCVSSWWWAVKGQSPGAEWDTYRQQVLAGLRAAEVVVAPTQAMLSMLQACYEPLPRTRVILNGRSGSLFRPGDKQPIVLSAGRFWDEAKNLATLDVAAQYMRWPVYVAGDTRHPNGQDCQPRHVRRLGQLTPDELGRWLGCASIYVLPARYEPFGLSALEAALAGCCLVLGDLPTLREVWDDSAVFVDPNDPAAIQAAVNNLTLNDDRRDWLARRARQRALELTPQRMATDYHDLYRQLLAPRQPGSGRSQPASSSKVRRALEPHSARD
jgi:glycogen synthase